MNTKTKQYGIIAAFILILLVAAQCGVATESSTGQRVTPTEIETSQQGAVEAKEVTADAEPSADEQEHDDAMAEVEHDEADDHAEEHEEEHSEEADHDQEHAMEPTALEPLDLGAGEKLQVVAITNIIGDMVRNVASDRVDLTILIPTGSDPHTFQPAPQDVALITDAQVVFANGLNYEEFLAELIDNAGGDALVIYVAEGIETREFEGEHEHDDEHDEEHGHDEEAMAEGDHAEEEHGEDHAAETRDEHDEAEHHHHHEGVDPHAWMTPHNALVYVHNIEVALSKLDPANAETYVANGEAYESQLETLDQWVFEQIETIPAENRQMVTDHEAFGYYADRYGLEIVGAVIPSYTTAAEPSAQELAELEETIGEFNVPAIFIGTGVNPALAKQVAADTGTKLVPLYTESLGSPGSGVETYIDFIRYNTMAIAQGLTP